jgi:hypothetical protein
MATRRLGEKDIDQLLTEYRSERRRLIFQLDRVREAISDLKGLRDGKEAANGVASTRKTAARKTTRRKPGRRKKRTVTGGYRLSDWDTMVVDLITKRNQLLPKQDILAHATTWAKKHHSGMSADEVEAKITRVLQKLSGKRGVLGTHRSGLRRGYHYGIKDWFFSTSGLLRKQHFDKLVLTDK